MNAEPSPTRQATADKPAPSDAAPVLADVRAKASADGASPPGSRLGNLVTVHPAGEGEAAASSGGASVISTSLATLLAGHILQDGEVVLLILRPSLWFIILSSLRFIGAVGVLLALLGVFRNHLDHDQTWVRCAEALLLLLVARLMWASLQWMGRLYVLTDMRILRLSGVFNMEIFDCPLRKVARLHFVRIPKERLLGLGSIDIIPQDESLPIGTWQTIAHPRQVYDQMQSAIRRARQGGWPSS